MAVSIGTVMAFAGKFNKQNLKILETDGWLPCDGRSLRHVTAGGQPTPYSDLYGVIGENFGDGYEEDNSKTGDFNLPDCRGRFLRGVDSGIGRDPNSAARTAMRHGGKVGDNPGSIQSDVYAKHSHSASGTLNALEPFSNVIRANAEWPSGFAGGSAFDDGGSKGVSRSQRSVSVSVDDRGGDETRPKNLNINWIIKFKSN